MVDGYDVAVIGAGVAGIAAAARLALDGHAVLLVGSHDRHPREFRAEKFGVFEAEMLAGLGLWDVSRGSVTSLDEVLLGQWGKPVGRVAMREYSMRYPDFVDALRAGLPPGIHHRTGRVVRVAPAGSGQEVALADGHVARARLVVLATGLMDGLRRDLGIGRTTVSKAHSLVYGFDLPSHGSPRGLAFQSLTWRGERFGDGIAYLTLFPLGGSLRANLFTHWDPAGAEAAAFAADPAGALAERLPALARLVGPILADGSVERRAVDLFAAQDHRRDGVVLIGDAFCTSCPSTGTGIRKVLTDVDRLAVHARRWLASSGAGAAGPDAAGIAAFYADPVKAACDGRSVALSLHGRRMLTDRSLAWRFRRLRSLVYRRGGHEIAELGLPPRWMAAPRAAADPGSASMRSNPPRAG